MNHVLAKLLAIAGGSGMRIGQAPAGVIVQSPGMPYQYYAPPPGYAPGPPCGPDDGRSKGLCCPPFLNDMMTQPGYINRPGCSDKIISQQEVIPAGATESVTLTPNVPFCIERIMIPSSIAPFFDINTFMIGNVPQTAGGGATNAEVFAQGSVDAVVRGSCVPAAVPIVLSVTNNSGIQRTFMVTLIGKTLSS